MSILEMQRAFVNLLTDDEARETYSADPTAFLSRYDLDRRESAALTQVDAVRLRIYARMLVSSRVQLGLKAFPHVEGLLPPDFIQRYGPRYGREHPRTVEQDAGPLAREARRLVAFIERLVAEGELSHPALLDMLHYDAIRYSLANDPSTQAAIAEFEQRASAANDRDALQRGRVLRSPGVVVRAFDHELIANPDSSPAAALVPAPAPVLMLFQKSSGTRRVSIYRVNTLTQHFLELCDGRHTMADVARQLPHAQRITVDECVRLGVTLAARRVIGAVSVPPTA